MGQMATRTGKGLGVLRTVTTDTRAHGTSSAQELGSPTRLHTPGGLGNLNPAVEMMGTAASKYVFVLFFRHEVLLGCHRYIQILPMLASRAAGTTGTAI